MCEVCTNSITCGGLTKNSSYGDLPGLIGLFYNLGVVQFNQFTEFLCYKCRYVNTLLERLVLDEVKIYHLVDRLLSCAGPTGFIKFFRDLTDSVLQGTSRPGRVFMLLSCLTRAGRLWSREALETVTQLLTLTNCVLGERIKHFSLETFLNHFGLNENKTFAEKAWAILVNFVWKLFGRPQPT